MMTRAAGHRGPSLGRASGRGGAHDGCMRLVIGALLLAATVQAARAADGVTPPAGLTSHSGGCGWIPATWNVPYGAVVLIRSNGGTIRPLIDALGEKYTHAQLSIGAAGVVQAEMVAPGANSWPAVCTVPVDPGQLRAGFPGVSRVDLGAVYADIYGGQGPAAVDYKEAGDPALASMIAVTAQMSPEVLDASRADPGQRIARKLRDGAPIAYSLYQYKDVEAANLVPSRSAGGMVCSTFLAFAHAAGGAGVVEAFTYDHASVAQAANVLAATVNGQCRSGFGFWGRALLGVSCLFRNVCENAGDQVTNCMAADVCDSDDNRIWHRVRDDPTEVARSISPDRLAGLPPHGRATVWSDDPIAHPVVFSAGGAQYGCWY